jgi:amidohydrolase
MDAVKKIIVDAVDDRRQELTAMAEQLFHAPETGLEEFGTSALLMEKLASSGFSIERGIAGLETAFRASWGIGSPTIAILAEMDALPAMGHACGHNIIAAAAIGAALALRRALSVQTATIEVLGTPAEELGIGKFEMIKSGVFDRVDFAMMVHPSSRRQVIKMFLGLARIHFTFFGRSAHAAAYPEEGINALDGVILTFNGINALRQQLHQDVRVHGIITEGGSVPNLVPDRAACYFYVRAADGEELIRSLERVKGCARGAAEATGCRLEIEADERVLAPMKINMAFSALYSDQLAFLGLEEAHAPADRNRGSSDIGNVSQVVPTIHPHVPIGHGLHIHTAEFARATISPEGKDAVIEGAKTLALTAAALACSPAHQEKIKKEFRSL